MILRDLFNSQKENKEKYNFVIYFKDKDIINISLEYMKIEYTIIVLTLL